MRRITRATWWVMGGALLASLLSVAALSRVASQPRLATTLPGATAAPLLSVVTPDHGVLVVTASGAYRVRPDLKIAPLEWKEYGRIVAVRSAAWWHDQLVMLASVERDGLPRLDVLFADGERLWTLMQGGYNALAVTVENGNPMLYTSSGGTVSRAPLQGEREVAFKAPDEAQEGVLVVDGKPHLLIGERGAHWLIDGERKLHAMPEGAYSVWSASLLRPPTNSPSRVPFLDAHGRTHVYAPAGAPVLRVDADGTLSPIAVSRSVDEPGVIVTSEGDQRVEVKHTQRRVFVASNGRPAWRAVATSTLPCDFQAIPVGDQWLLLGDHGYEAVALDGALARADAGEAMFVALTSQPLGVWLVLLALLGAFTALLPVVLRHTVRILRLTDDKSSLYLGTLKLPPGAVGATGRDGRVNLAGDCQLRAGARTYDLSPGPLRADAGAPLCDGDAVYVLGRVAADQSGGPWRASHRERLVPDGGRYVIGRGDGAEFVRQWSARANGRLMGFALAHLTLALGVLGFLGLRPFI